MGGGYHEGAGCETGRGFTRETMGKALGLLKVSVLLTFGLVGFHGGERGRMGRRDCLQSRVGSTLPLQCARDIAANFRGLRLASGCCRSQWE